MNKKKMPLNNGIPFQWLLNSPNVNFLNTSYTLQLYEVSGEAESAEYAMTSGQARLLYESPPQPDISLLYSAF